MAITSVQSIVLLLGCESCPGIPRTITGLAQTERNSSSYPKLVKFEDALEHFTTKGSSSPLVVEN